MLANHARRRLAAVTRDAAVRPTRPRPRIARPAIAPVPRPPPEPAALASAVAIDDRFAELTPLHRSLAALRVDAAGAD